MKRTSLLLAFALLLLPTAADAQSRSTTGRARMELSADHGVGFGSEGMYGELATDVRLVDPSGFGGVLRVGLASNGLSNALAVDLGAAYRLNLFVRPDWGVQLGLALGPSFAWGPFDQGMVAAWGGFSMLHLDVWVGTFFAGVGVTAHALMPERHSQVDGRADAILTVAPVIRVGGDWGL